MPILQGGESPLREFVTNRATPNRIFEEKKNAINKDEQKEVTTQHNSVIIKTLIGLMNKVTTKKTPYLLLRADTKLCRGHLEHILISGNPQCPTLQIRSNPLKRGVHSAPHCSHQTNI